MKFVDSDDAGSSKTLVDYIGGGYDKNRGG